MCPAELQLLMGDNEGAAGAGDQLQNTILKCGNLHTLDISGIKFKVFISLFSSKIEEWNGRVRRVLQNILDISGIIFKLFISTVFCTISIASKSYVYSLQVLFFQFRVLMFLCVFFLLLLFL